MDDTETLHDAPKKRSSTILRVLLLFIVLIAACFGYMRFFANQRAGGQQVYDNLAVFDTRLQNIENSTLLHEKRIKDLEDATQKLAAAPAASTSAPVASSSAAPATGTPQTAPISATTGDERIAALEKEIASLKAASPLRDNDTLLQSIRLLSAFHRLSDKVIGGKPFAAELTAFEQLTIPDTAPGSPLAILTPYADSGIPTFATLLVTFDQSVDGLNASEAVPPSTADFSERLKYNLTHLIRVHRIDEAQTGNTTDAIVGRAQAHLEHEEVEAAVSEIKSLPENARSNFAAWLDDAQMVTEAPSLVGQIEEQVMQKAFHAENAGQPQASPAAPVSPSFTPLSTESPKL